MRRFTTLPFLLFGLLFVPSTAYAKNDSAAESVITFRANAAGAIEPWLAARAEWLLETFLGSPLWAYLAALVTIVTFALGGLVVTKLSINILQKVTKKTETDIDDQLIVAVNPPLFYVVFVCGVFVGKYWLNLPEGLEKFLLTAFRVALIIIVGWGVLRCTGILTTLLGKLAAVTSSELDDALVPLVGRSIKLVLTALIITLCLQEVGFNVAGLLAGLGVGGLAFALAAQDTISNWFGALMIYTDRPFDVGDWIKTGELEGVVEEIGLRSTKVRTFSKTVLSIPNRTLANGAVENFSRMPRRRIRFKLGVTYNTTPDMMRALVKKMQDLLRHNEQIDQTFWLCKFTEFGDSSLNIFVYCFTNSTDWDEYCSVREGLNLDLMDAMASFGIEAAFPSRSVYIDDTNPAETVELDSRAKKFLATQGDSPDFHHDVPVPSDADG